MSRSSLEIYRYEDLPTETAFRIAELQPGKDGDSVVCSLRIVQWPDLPKYEGISYSWGDPKLKVPIVCDGKKVEVSPNLQSALTHFRHQDRPRFLWADALW